MKTKAIIIDLDGTAVASPEQKLPTQRLVQAIKKLQQNYYVCSATGRVWSFAKSVLQALQLHDPCIISAGTQICHPDSGKVLWQKTIDEGALTQVLEIFRGNPDYKLLHNDGTEDDYFFGGISPKDFTHTQPIYFLEQVFVPDELAIQVYEKLNQVPGITCVMVPAQKPNTRDLHVINSAATKEHAVVELLQRIWVDRSDTIGVGDGHNDIHLFNAVGHKVAMGNAVPDLKARADRVIGSVKEDGLAIFFEQLNAETL